MPSVKPCCYVLIFVFLTALTNPLYGFRTKKTLQDPEVWYPTNRVAGFWYMALREIPGRMIDGILSLITEITSFVLFVTGREHKALHDWIAGTVVLHDPNKVLSS